LILVLVPRAHLEHLKRLGIDYQQVTDGLEREGLTKFENSWDELGGTVSHELHAAGREPGDHPSDGDTIPAP